METAEQIPTLAAVVTIQIAPARVEVMPQNCRVTRSGLPEEGKYNRVPAHPCKGTADDALSTAHINMNLIFQIPNTIWIVDGPNK